MSLRNMRLLDLISRTKKRLLDSIQIFAYTRNTTLFLIANLRPAACAAFLNVHERADAQQGTILADIALNAVRIEGAMEV